MFLHGNGWLACRPASCLIGWQTRQNSPQLHYCCTIVRIKPIWQHKRSMSVPLTSSWAKQKSVCFLADRTLPHVSESCTATGRSHRCRRCVYRWTSKPKQCFGHKIAECCFNIELLTDRLSDWLFNERINRQKGKGNPEGCRLIYWLDADSRD